MKTLAMRDLGYRNEMPYSLGEPSVTVGSRLPETQATLLANLAKERGISISTLFREIVTDWIGRQVCVRSH